MVKIMTKTLGARRGGRCMIENPVKKAFEQVFYVDIKSEGLRNVIILRDVRGLSLTSADQSELL